ncbi:unnamed protein product [Rodentolepis nana]|uniref:Secreted protein n=1 Tax=Rodentolepis nana TaxID=102285 RepID=A0A0R3TIB3_RODNA|nr:unnamed protein product [Rodentolepis nana]
MRRRVGTAGLVQRLWTVSAQTGDDFTYSSAMLGGGGVLLSPPQLIPSTSSYSVEQWKCGDILAFIVFLRINVFRSADQIAPLKNGLDEPTSARKRSHCGSIGAIGLARRNEFGPFNPSTNDMTQVILNILSPIAATIFSSSSASSFTGPSISLFVPSCAFMHCTSQASSAGPLIRLLSTLSQCLLPVLQLHLRGSSLSLRLFNHNQHCCGGGQTITTPAAAVTTTCSPCPL